MYIIIITIIIITPTADEYRTKSLCEEISDDIEHALAFYLNIQEVSLHIQERLTPKDQREDSLSSAFQTSEWS